MYFCNVLPVFISPDLFKACCLITILVGSLTPGVRAEAMDMTGAWATDATACKKMF